MTRREIERACRQMGVTLEPQYPWHGPGPIERKWDVGWIGNATVSLLGRGRVLVYGAWLRNPITVRTSRGFRRALKERIE